MHAHPISALPPPQLNLSSGSHLWNRHSSPNIKPIDKLYQTPLGKAPTSVSVTSTASSREKKEKQRGLLGRFRAKKKEDHERKFLFIYSLIQNLTNLILIRWRVWGSSRAQTPFQIYICHTRQRRQLNTNSRFHHCLLVEGHQIRSCQVSRIPRLTSRRQFSIQISRTNLKNQKHTIITITTGSFIAIKALVRLILPLVKVS